MIFCCLKQKKNLGKYQQEKTQSMKIWALVLFVLIFITLVMGYNRENLNFDIFPGKSRFTDENTSTGSGSTSTYKARFRKSATEKNT